MEMWLERAQRRIYYREGSSPTINSSVANLDNESAGVKTIDISTITKVGPVEGGPSYTTKDVERGFVLEMGKLENNNLTQLILLAEDPEMKNNWVDGLTLACNFQGQESGTLIQEILDLFVVQSEVLDLKKEAEQRPPIPPAPQDLNFQTGPISNNN